MCDTSDASQSMQDAVERGEDTLPAAAGAARPGTTRRRFIGGSLAALASSELGLGRALAAATASGPATIDLWLGVGPDSAKVYRQLLDRFHAANPDITVRVNSFGEYEPLQTALQAAIAGKRPPAIAQIGFDIIQYAARFLPHLKVDAAAAAAGVDGAHFLADSFSPQMLSLGRVNGQDVLPQLIGSPYLFYNRDVLAAAGIEQAPDTWPALRTVAQRVTAKTGKPCFSMAEKGYFWAYQGLIESNGALLLAREGDRYVTQIDQPGAIEAMQLMADMVLEDKSALYLGDAQAGVDYQNGNLPMMIGFSSQVAGAVAAGKFRVGTAPLPAWPGKARRIPMAGSGFMVFDVGDAPAQAAAWRLVAFFCDPAVQAAFTKGTGYPPTRLGVAEDPAYLGPFYKDNPLFGPDIAQLAVAVPWISFPGRNGPQALQVLDETRDHIFSGESVAAVMKAAAGQINDLINS